jgi:DNA-binding NtrC family response regulator
VLRDEGYVVEAVESGEACLDRLARTAFDVVVLDVWLPGIDGLVTLRAARAAGGRQVVMISGHGNIESAVRAIKMGAFDFVEKPLSLEKTVLVVRNALRQRSSRPRTGRCARASTVASRWWARATRCAAARAGRDGGADQRPRADLRRERHRQGAGGAQRSTR